MQTATPMTNGLMNVIEAAKYLEYQPNTIYQMRYDGKLTGQKIGQKLYFSQEELDEYKTKYAYDAVATSQDVVPLEESTEESDLQTKMQELERASALLDFYGKPESERMQVVVRDVQPVTVKTITFGSGTLTVSYALDLFQASEKERFLILNIIDVIKQYEKMDKEDKVF